VWLQLCGGSRLWADAPHADEVAYVFEVCGLPPPHGGMVCGVGVARGVARPAPTRGDLLARAELAARARRTETAVARTIQERGTASGREILADAARAQIACAPFVDGDVPFEYVAAHSRVLAPGARPLFAKFGALLRVAQTIARTPCPDPRDASPPAVRTALQLCTLAFCLPTMALPYITDDVAVAVPAAQEPPDARTLRALCDGSADAATLMRTAWQQAAAAGLRERRPARGAPV